MDQHPAAPIPSNGHTGLNPPTAGPRGVVSSGTGTPRHRHNQARVEARLEREARTGVNQPLDSDLRWFRSVDGNNYAIQVTEDGKALKSTHMRVMTYALVEMVKGGSLETVFECVNMKLVDGVGALMIELHARELLPDSEDQVEGMTLG